MDKQFSMSGVALLKISKKMTHTYHLTGIPAAVAKPP